MSLKIALFCVQALFLQEIFGSHCACNGNEGVVVAGNGYSGWGCGSGVGAAHGVGSSQWANNIANIGASNGGGFSVISTSPYAPGSLSVHSENAIEGAVSVAGALPFLSAVALEGALPTAGAGSVAYGCGNGNVAIVSENAGAIGASPVGAHGYGVNSVIGGAGVGYGANVIGVGGCGSPAAINVVSGYGNHGCGCGVY